MSEIDVFDLMAKISLDTSEYESGLSGASSTTSSFGEKLGNGLATAAKVGAAAIAAATTAAVAFGASAVSAAAEWETAFAQVETIMDTSQMSTSEMSSAIQALSSEMGIAATDLSETVYNAISATGDTANAVSLAAQASQLATAGFTDTSSALSVLTTAMNAYGMSADEAADISDSLIMVQNLGVTTVSELSASMGKAIASASAYGVDLTNLESAYVSMTKAGINTAESTTYISSMLKELGDSGSDVAAILQEQTGQSFDQLMADGNSLADVLDVLYESVDGDSTALMNLWSSAEAGKASNAIISQGLEEFNENLIAIGDSAGATETAYATMADTFDHKLSVLQTTFTNLETTIGEELLPTLSEFLEFGTEGLTTFSEAFQEGGLSGAMDVLGGILSDGIAMITEMLPTVVEAGTQLLMSLLQGITDNLPQLIEAAIQIINQLVSSIEENLPMLLTAALDTILALANGLIEMLPDLIPAIVEIVMQIVETLTDPDTLDNLIVAALDLIIALAEGLMDALPKIAEKAPYIVMNLAEALVKAGPRLLTAALELVVTLVTGIVKNLVKMVEVGTKIVTSVKEGFLKKIEDAKNWGKDLITNFISGITEKWNKLKETVSNVASTVKSFLGFSEPEEGPLSNFHTYAPDMMELFAKGIRDNEDIVKNQIAKSFDFGTATVDYASSSLGQQQSGISSALSTAVSAAGENITITVQSVLDGKVIGETAYQYSKNKNRAYGVA